MKKDDTAVVFFITETDGKDEFYIYKMKVKNEEDKELYSTPILGTSWQWQSKLEWIKKLEQNKDKESGLKAKVESDLMLFNSDGNFCIGNDKEIIKWGLSIDEEIKKLKINGQSPTEIMTIKLDNDDVYFWYYESLSIDTMNDEIDISF